MILEINVIFSKWHAKVKVMHFQCTEYTSEWNNHKLAVPHPRRRKNHHFLLRVEKTTTNMR